MADQKAESNQKGKTRDEILKSPMKSSLIESLYDAQVIDAHVRDEAISYVQPSLNWRYWIDKFLLFLGAALVLAGIIFFFAFNWEKMARSVKFGIIEAGIIACIAAVFIIGRQTLTGKVFLFCASVLIGVFLAVFGQIYQTGADSYEMFLAWALLIFGWVVISKFAPLWLFWLAIVNICIGLYWNQILIPGLKAYDDVMWLVLSLIDIIALVLYFLGRYRDIEWLKTDWYYRLIYGFILYYLSAGAIQYIVNELHSSVFLLLMFVVFGLISVWFFRFKVPDIVALTLAGFSFCVILLTQIGYYFFKGNHAQWIESLLAFLFGLVVIAVCSLVIYVLLKISRSIEKESSRREA